MRLNLLVLLMVPAILPAARGGEGFLLRPGQRVVFLGDSNTYAGTYVQYLGAYLRCQFPDEQYELIFHKHGCRPMPWEAVR